MVWKCECHILRQLVVDRFIVSRANLDTHVDTIVNVFSIAHTHTLQFADVQFIEKPKLDCLGKQQLVAHSISFDFSILSSVVDSIANQIEQRVNVTHAEFDEFYFYDNHNQQEW